MSVIKLGLTIPIIAKYQTVNIIEQKPILIKLLVERSV